MILIDIVTGILKAFSEGKLWSHKAITGYIKNSLSMRCASS